MPTARTTPIPSSQKFLSGSMERILKDRINAVAQQRARDEGTSSVDSYKYAEETQRIATTLIKLNLTSKNKLYIRNVTTRNNGMISFLPKGQECLLTSDGKWSRQNRVDCKAGKFLNKVKNERGYDWTAQDIEQFVNYYKSKTIVKGEFSVVKGEEIREWYHYSTYQDGSGSLNNSCMKYDQCGKYFGIYTDNPEVSMIVLVNDEDKLVGRALLWNNRYMDRVYGSDDTIVAFHNFADDNEYIPIFQCSVGNISVELSYTEFDRYPYMDSLSQIFSRGVANHHSSSIGTYVGSAQSTGGYLEGNEDNYDEDYYCSCEDCGCGMYEDDYYYINDQYYCSECICYSEVHGEDIPRHQATRLHDGDYCYDDCTVVLHNGNYAWQDDDYLIGLPSGEYALEDEVTYCDYSEQHYLTNEVILYSLDDITIVNLNVDDYLHEEYGFRLIDYSTTIDHADESEVQDIIKRHLEADDHTTVPVDVYIKPATDTRQQIELFATTIGESNHNG